MRGRFVEENEQEKENKDLVGVRKPKKKAYEKSHTPKITSQCSDSNRGPAHYECAALPTELHWPIRRSALRTARYIWLDFRFVKIFFALFVCFLK